MGNSSSTSTMSSETGNSASTSDFEAKSLGMTKVNDSVWMLQNSSGKTPSTEIIFFHGLHMGSYERAFWKTWLARDNESIIWPKHWLGKAHPNARILSISYNMSAIKDFGQLDMYCLGENLVSDISMDHFNIGQSCPVILVGHCLGGIVLKQFILSAQKLKIEKEKAGKYQSPEGSSRFEIFLGNLKGVFFYGTPHIPGSDVAKFAKSSSCSSKYINKLLETCDATLVRIKNEFSKFQCSRNIKAFAIAEGCPTTVWGFDGFVVNESSARHDIDNYYTATNADHFNVCRPRDMESCGIFRKLQHFILDATSNKVVLEAGFFENKQPLPKKVVGLDLLVNKVQNTWQEKATLGIVGMGGIGKSTLAKALFNKLNPGYEYSCFVSDVKFISGTREDVKKKVLKSMHCHGKPISNGWSVLRGRSLLLVLDDVSQDRDLEVFTYLLDVIEIAPESCFIVTSRDRDFLNCSTTTDIFFYDFSILSKEDSKQLFVSYALSSKAVQQPWLEIYVEKVVDKCGGLPLTLEVLGNYLKSRTDNMKIWEQTLVALDKAEDVASMDLRLWAKLRLSYDALGEKEQKMFLDTTTFFSNHGGWDSTLRQAKAAWSVMYGMEDILWRTLVDRSLVYDVAEDDVIRVHEQLLSLGRKIASELSKNQQWRAWETPAALNLLQSRDERNAKELLSLNLHVDSSNIVIPRSSLGMLKNLHYLEMYCLGRKCPLVIDGVEANEVFPLDSLVVLRSSTGLHFGNVPLDLARSRSLAVLHLDLHSFRDYSFGSLGGLVGLKILILERAYDLDILPDEIGNLSQLERFELTRCMRLRTVPSTFGRLSRLKHLKFSSCLELDSLPESFGRLPDLEHLTFLDCSRLQSLPESFGELPKLEVLRFEHCQTLHTLPESFGELPKLKDLRFERCETLHTLPESLGGLSTLSHLSFYSCPNLQTLPGFESFCRLPGLQVLKIYDCPKIDSLLFFTGQSPAALRHLCIGLIGLTSIPECWKSWPSLQTLEIYVLPDLNEFPPWLGGTSLGRPAMLSGRTLKATLSGRTPSMWKDGKLALQQEPRFKTFEQMCEDGKLALQQEPRFKTFEQMCEERRVIRWVHEKAMGKLGTVQRFPDRASHNGGVPDYAGALAHLDAHLDPKMLPHHLSGFILLERAILKRETGDLDTAVEDVTIALENFALEKFHFKFASQVCMESDCISKSEVQEMRYRCLVHRAYIRRLAGNEEGAGDDARQATELQYGPIFTRQLPSPSLGKRGVLDFPFLTRQEREAQANRMKMLRHENVYLSRNLM